MPELPEVETIVRTLAPQVTGCRLEKVHILLPKSLEYGASHIPSLAIGATITRVFRRGKLAMLELAPQPCVSTKKPSEAHAATDCPPSFYMAFHLKMTGRFCVHPAGTEPFKHTRLIFDLESSPSHNGPPAEQRRLFFDDMRTFGYCRIMLPHELEAWPFWQQLGPEPLELSATLLAQAIGSHKGSIKGVLLNQHVVAGVGNIYADESLFQARISPLTRAESLLPKQTLSLARALQAVLQQSIEECGSSIRDYRDANGNAGAFQNSFHVYGRKGELCTVCKTPLITTKVAGRGTVYCPSCQK